MRILSCRLNESIVIGNIALRLADIRGGKVRFNVSVTKEAIDPAWLAWNDGTVRKLARAIAEEGSCDALPILADALEEAGCNNGVILGHCRSRLQDVRRSWLVDLILSVP